MAYKGSLSCVGSMVSVKGRSFMSVEEGGYFCVSGASFVER